MNATKSVKGLFAVAAASALVAVGFAGAQPAKKDKDKGHQHEHQQKAVIGQPAPDFALTDLEGKEHTLSALTEQDKVVVLEWYNPDCPYIVRHHAEQKTMNDIANDYKDRGVVFLAINSGAEGKQGAGRDYNKRKSEEFGDQFPLLLDESGEVGKAYGAKTTPHMFVINADGILVYQGAIDDDKPGKKDNDINYVRQALDEVLAGQTVTNAETRPYGCSVKYGH